MLSQARLKADREYKKRLREKGIQEKHIWVSEQQWAVIKPIADCIRKLDLKYVSGIDVSDDLLEYKIIMDVKTVEVWRNEQK